MDRDVGREMRRVKELLTQERLFAGYDYCNAIISLGLDPDIMAWVYEPKVDQIHLALVSSLVDRVGPDSIYDLLFRAYDVSATPKDIDPFIVSLYSPNMDMAVDLLNYIKPSDNGFLDFKPGKTPPHIFNASFVIGIAEPKIIFGVGVYRVRTVRRNADQDRSRWQTFSSNVNKIAA